MKKNDSYLSKDEMMENFKKRILAKDPNAFREHTFKVGQIISDFKNEESFDIVLKVVAVSKYSVLVKDLTYKEMIPYTLQPKSWDKFNPIEKQEFKKWRSARRRSKMWENVIDVASFLSDRLNVTHTREPKKLSDYLANFLAFVVTYSSRKQMEVYSPNEPNLFKGLFAHGPIYPGQNI